MRRALVSVIAVPALLLSACGGDEPEVEESNNNSAEEVQETEDSTDEAEETTEDAAETTEEAEPTEDEAEETEDAGLGGDDAETTEDAGLGGGIGGDDAEETEDGSGGEEGGDAGGDASGEGQAAADVTKEWLVAFVNGEDEVCDMMLDLSSEGPMADNPTDYDICVSVFPGLASEVFTEETARIMEAMEINGATVEGDTATVSKDNFSEMFAAGFGDETIVLKQVHGTWYVDMNESSLTN